MRQTLHILLIGMLAAASLLVQACATRSGSGTGDDAMARQEYIDEPEIKHIQPPNPGVMTSRPGPSKRVELSARNATGLPQGTLTDILFDFDQASLRSDALPVLEANARQLMHRGVTRLMLEGRGDEVGTAAYNIVLGDRRAKRVKSYLQDVGLDVELKTTSYGKDRPLCFQHSPACLQKNRSVHFVVKE